LFIYLLEVATLKTSERI